MYKQILVTGGAGFVGSHVSVDLRRTYPDANVTALDNLRRRGSELNLDLLREAGIQFVQGDVRNREDLEAVEAPDLIVECSAEPSVLAGYGGSPEYLINTNLNGCFHCLELARKYGSDFVFLSTSRVYPVAGLNSLHYAETDTRFSLAADQQAAGSSEHGVSEEFSLTGARSLYGMSKLCAELMIEEYASAYGIRFIINRCGLLTGPRQMAKSDQGVIALWAAAHYFGRPLQYIGFGGCGKQVRDILHVSDLCDLLRDQLAHLDRYGNRTFNVGGGVELSLSLLEVTAICRQISGREIEISASSEERPADVRIYISDSRKVRGVNGWAPRRDATATIGSIVDWIRGDEQRIRAALGF